MAAEIDPRAAWSRSEHLLAGQVDALALLVWAKTKDAQHGRNRPKPIPRPGDQVQESRFTDVQAMPVDDLKAALARPRR